MALFRKFFYRKPPEGLLEISERVYVFDCCFTTEVLEEDEYKVYIGGIVGQLRESLTDASFMVFNFREGEHHSLITNILSVYDMTVMDYPRQYEGCPLLTMEMIHHFLRSSESWLSLGQQNVLLMHCERGGWPVLAFMLAALLIYRKQYAGEQKTLDMIYKQAPRELLQLMSPLNPLPSQLRYLQYVSRRNVASEWPPLDRALTLDCIIIRFIPNMDGEGGCRPIFRIYGQDPFMAADRTSKVLFSTPKKSKLVRQYKQVDCELVKIDIHCHIQGDVVLECISLDNDLEREEMMFRVMFNTAFIRSNILMLNRDDIDILWHAKDQFPKDFRAEVLFSEMDASASLISIELPNIEEKDGLPIEAFARVQEIFSNVDWLSPKADAALNVLQKITASNLLQEKLVSSGSLDRSQLLDLSLEKLILESETSEGNVRSPRLKIQTKQSQPSSELSHAVSSVISKIEPSELQVSLQLPPQSKIITQRISQPSLSTPASFRSSVQGSPRPILRYHSAPSALGITALLHDHSNFSGKEVIHPATISSPSSALDSPKDIQPCKLPISPLPLVLEPRSTLENSSTTASTSTIPDPLSLHQLSLKPIKSLVSKPSQTTAQVRSQLSPSSSQPTSISYLVESPPSLNDNEASRSPSSPLLRPSPSSCTKESFSISTPPPPPPPPLPHLDSLALATSPSSSRTNDSIFPSSPQPPSTTQLLSSTKTSIPTIPEFSSSNDCLVYSHSPKKNLTSAPPCCSPNLGASVVSPTSVPPPPPRPTPAPFMEDSINTFMHEPQLRSSSTPASFMGGLYKHIHARAPSSTPTPPLPPSSFSLTSTCDSSITPLGAPPSPPPPSSLAPQDVATVVRNLMNVSGPPPPPPPPLHPSLGPNTVSLVPPPPPPPPSLAPNVSATTVNLPHISGPPPPPPPPFANSGPTLCPGDVTSAPPVPPPPGFSMKGSPTHAPPAPPPPGLSGNTLSNVNGTSSQSHVGINNSNIPSIPGPPSSALFNAKGRGLGRLNSKNQSQTKRSNLKPYHWLKLTRAMQGSLWAETQKADEASKAPEFDMSELESLFSAAAPNSDSGGSGGNSNRRASGPKSDKVHLIELRRAYNCEIMLSKVKIPLPDMMCSVLALDDSALDVDQVENLIKFCPTKEEMELLKGYSGDKDNLGKCEQFFLELMKVPRVESKLRVFSFKIQFRLQASDLRSSLNIINSASEEIRSSVKLKRVMQTILSLGNALNHGTARGSAIGFRLDSLLKLTDTRARNNKMTLMHYLCKVLAEKLPELLDFPKDLVSLEASTKIQLKYLAEEMQAISKGLEKVVQELANSENDGRVSGTFCRTLKGFLSHAEAEVRSLASLYSNVGRNADALALYFGEDPARCPFEQVVSTLFNFVRMFVRAHEENCKQLEYEKKKAQKEAAEKEKLKVNTPKKESGFLMQTPT
ncbi:formin-like protein 18 [Benincasa hispida]|uniref:formin-like protein 18 n=1 Tax=Benincasa hispida TaxID=102211 RepID=UPI0018FF1E95|nr:formin-like protein 18 [Benincasa hispida]